MSRLQARSFTGSLPNSALSNDGELTAHDAHLKAGVLSGAEVSYTRSAATYCHTSQIRVKSVFREGESKVKVIFLNDKVINTVDQMSIKSAQDGRRATLPTMQFP